VVFVTVPSAIVALELGRRSVDERLTACASVVPGVTSIVAGDGTREEAPDTLLVIKAPSERRPALPDRGLELQHTYAVPEVLALPVEAGAPAYPRWIHESVGTEGR